LFTVYVIPNLLLILNLVLIELSGAVLKVWQSLTNSNRNAKLNRIKGPLRKPGTFLSLHPLEHKFVHNESALKQKKNKALWLEHKTFMKRLQISRFLRSTVETMAATHIQKAYRGYYIRVHKNELTDSCLLRQKIRSKIRDFVVTHSGNKLNGIILTLGQHRQHYKEWRYEAACTIQRTFRIYLSIRRVTQTRSMKKIVFDRMIVLRMQQFARKIIAKRKVRALRLKRFNFRSDRGARLVQTAFRCLIARRKVSRRRYIIHGMAVTMIQCCFRIYRVQRLVKMMKQRITAVKTFHGALTLQCLARCRKAISKVRARRSIRMEYQVNLYSSTIQALIRGFLARVRVNKIRGAKKLNDTLKALTSSSDSNTATQDQDEVEEQDLEEKLQPMYTENLKLDEIFNLLIAPTSSNPGRVEAMRLLLIESSSYINDIYQGNGMTILQSACVRCDYDVVKLLLHVVDRKSTDDEGCTALHRACGSPSQSGASSLSLVYLLLGKYSIVYMVRGRVMKRVLKLTLT
jgi:hypothetical protein